MKYDGWHRYYEAESFEAIIGPFEEKVNQLRNAKYYINIRTKSPSANLMGEDFSRTSHISEMRDFVYINNWPSYVQLIEGNIYLFSYTGKLRDEVSAFAGFKDGELKEFKDITSGFSVRKFV